MKKLLFVLVLFVLGSCSKYDQINQTIYFNGETYTIHTYSTGLFGVPKQALDLTAETSTPNEVKTIKQRQWNDAKIFIDAY